MDDWRSVDGDRELSASRPMHSMKKDGANRPHSIISRLLDDITAEDAELTDSSSSCRSNGSGVEM